MAEYIEYHPLKFWFDPASIAEIVAHIQSYLVTNPINSTTEIETIIHDYLIAHPELIGGVDSVNGQTGEVVLTADNISAGENVTIKDVLDSLQDQITDIASNVNGAFEETIDISDVCIYQPKYFINGYFNTSNGKSSTTSRFKRTQANLLDILPDDTYKIRVTPFSGLKVFASIFSDTPDYSNNALNDDIYITSIFSNEPDESIEVIIDRSKYYTLFTNFEGTISELGSNPIGIKAYRPKVDIKDNVNIALSKIFCVDGYFKTGGVSSATSIWFRLRSNLIDLLPKNTNSVHIIPPSEKQVFLYEFESRPLYANDANNSSILNNVYSSHATGFIDLELKKDKYYCFAVNTTIDNYNALTITAKTTSINDNIYYGKTFSVMGDSISSFSGVVPSENRYFYPEGNVNSPTYLWWYRLSEMTGLRPLVIQANSGSTVTTVNPDRVPCSDDARIESMRIGSTAPDYIFCCCGINDFFKLPVTDYGAWDGTTAILPERTTLKNSYAYMLSKMQKTYPNSKIYCCTVTQSIGRNFDLTLETVVSTTGERLIDFNNIVRELAGLFGCGIVDMASCGLNVNNLQSLTVDTAPIAVHPNIAGHYLMAVQAKKDICG